MVPSYRPTRAVRTLGALVLAATAAAPALQAQAIGLPRLSDASQECIVCHKKQNLGLYQQWGASKHYRGNVGCYECHAAEKGDKDAFEHYDRLISTLVTPKDCARCHSREVAEFTASHHAKAGRILGSLDNVLAEVVEGNRAFVTPGFPEGNSAAAANGCWQCHGSQVKILPDGKPDPATFPNSGIGRLNPDGSEGACTACHARHSFSVAQARHPDTCGKCHLGPDHPQKEIYEESKHGINFFANEDKMNLDSAKWIAGEDYFAAPTCATCHMSATKKSPVTHDVGLRISWNNRPVVSVRPEIADAKLGLPGKDIPWQLRREKMKEVCRACHQKNWIEGFYTQYDALVELYNEKFAKPGKELYALAKPLRPYQAPFSHEIDWIWFELWHHEGRRARHGASMMAPDYTHWHGTYEVARSFYTKFIPALKKLADEAMHSSDDKKAAAGKVLMQRIQKVLESKDHRWSIDRMDPEEKARRKKAREEFKKRYQKQ